MRFPFALTKKIASHIIKHKLRKTPKFAMVLQLEPLHTCNLTCTGCGRIREYSTSLKDMVPLEKCLEVARECDAPMVSICGGEPLIYPKIEELVNGLLAQGRVIYVCTNGVFMRKKMKDYLAAIYSPAIEPKLKKLLDQKLISDKDAETIRKSDDAAKKKTVIRPTNGCIGTSMWTASNSRTTSLSSARACSRNASRRSRWRRFSVSKSPRTPRSIAKPTWRKSRICSSSSRRSKWTATRFRPAMISITPRRTWSSASASDPKEFFLTRDMTRQKFAKIQEWGKAFTIFGTPVYQEFLAGKRELTCTAWAIPTYNIKGWKAPCYLMTDGHYSGYQEMLREVSWEKYGVVDGVARDPRCEHCMVHCGYDPSGALGTNYQRGDNWKNFKYNFGAKPKPFPASPELEKRAYNGVTIGKGHLAEAKAAINSPATGARGAFSQRSPSRGARRNSLRHERRVRTR